MALMAGVTACSGDPETLDATTTVEARGPGHRTADLESSDDIPISAETHRSELPPGRPGGAADSTGDSDTGTSEEPVEPTEDDIRGLLWMREEEQLAHDVYTVLGEQWGLGIFGNISRSEGRHVERIVGLLGHYGIEDPMVDRPSGTFTIPELQELYDKLVADGGESLVNALEVGATIEEIDIVDLRARATDVAGIQAAYDVLEQGSHNHLRAFVSQLDARDVHYEPAHLDAAAYHEIVSDGS